MDETSALDILRKTLEFYGLIRAGETDNTLLTDITTAWREQRITPNDSIDQIGIVMRDSQAFKDRFPANEALRAAGKPQRSISQYLALEADYANVMRANGIPAGFYDDPVTDFQQLIAGDVSPLEVQNRVEQGYRAVRDADPEVVRQFQELYGVNEGALAAYFIDPERMRPQMDQFALQRQAQSAAVAAQARLQGGLELSRAEAESLTAQGVTGEQAARGFAQLQGTQELFTPLAGEEEITRQQMIEGVVGTRAEAAQRIATRSRRRRAAFEQGGGFATGQTGIAGLTEA